MKYVKAATVEDFTGSDLKVLTFMGKKVAILKDPQGDYRAIQAGCPHQGADLTRGRRQGWVFTCPRHGWQYDFLSGACLKGNGPALRPYGCERRGDEIWVTIQPL